MYTGSVIATLTTTGINIATRRVLEFLRLMIERTIAINWLYSVPNWLTKGAVGSQVYTL